MKFQYSILRIGIQSALCAALFVSVPTHASDFGAIARVGLLGAGAELNYQLTDHLGLRLQRHNYSFPEDIEEDGINYSGSLDLPTFGLVLDFHPFGGSFRLTAGAYSNGKEHTGDASGSGDYEIGDETFTSVPTDTVKLDISVELGDSVAPYVGFIWGSSPDRERDFMFSLDLGALISGSPKVSLTASGTAVEQSTLTMVNMATDPTVQAEITKEIAALEDDISDFEIYPVIMLGIR